MESRRGVKVHVLKKNQPLKIKKKEHLIRLKEFAAKMKGFQDIQSNVTAFKHLACRIQRDVSVRGRDVAGVLEQYTSFVKPSYEMFVAPSRRHADVIIPWGS